MKLKILLLFLPFCGYFSAFSQLQRDEKPDQETDPVIMRKLDQWHDLKFGLLMHWGTYSQWGIVESWSICSEDEDWCRRKTKNYVDYCRDYVNLKTTFNPERFDPGKWAAAARYAGMKYVIFTTKHHDGFCMFDTRETDYRITDAACPFHTNPKADVTREIFNAFRANGFWTGAYFSKPDWHSDDYWAQERATPNRNVNYNIKKYPERWQKFCNFTFNQIRELMSQYGQVDILWLDGGWVDPKNGQDVNIPKIAAMARSFQPGLLVVDRSVTGKYENYRTPEQQIPDKILDYPWETCMTMATSWSYVPEDIYKPTGKIIHMLADIVCKGGNYLLNIGPSPEGEFADTAYARLHEIGDWMKINGEGIYGSRPIAPYKSGNICLTRGQDGSIYAIYLAETLETAIPATIEIKGIDLTGISRIEILGKKGIVKWKTGPDSVLIMKVPRSMQNNPPCKHAWTFKISRKTQD